MELFRIYKSIDSTNKEAGRLLQTGEKLHGTAILAFDQTDGHGQYGRIWHTEPGKHLALSIIIEPNNMQPADLPLLVMKTSLALVRALKKIDNSLHPLIKWPNDIYIDGKKLAGILIENSISSHKVQHCIIGIGMNVNETSFPDEIPNGVSLSMLTKKNYVIKTIAAVVKNEILRIVEEHGTDWKKEYDDIIFGLNQQVSFIVNGNQIVAGIEGITMEGKIVLDEGTGESKSYFSHEIKWPVA